MNRAIEVSAPARLHFGMMAVHGPDVRQYGGMGAMIAGPVLRLTIHPARRFQAGGPWAGAIEKAARIACPQLPCCRIELDAAPRAHVGLGSGTQLAMSVAAGIKAFLGGPPLDAAQLARLAGRGQRSAIGLHGFVHGGLLYEEGKLPTEDVAPLVARVALPVQWRFVLICPKDEEGLSGQREQQAFAVLPPVPAERTERMRRLAREQILPAARAGAFDEFAEGVYHFGYEAGLSFAAMQGGLPFAGPRLAALVERIRAAGIRGIGQSFWGPTLFAILPDQAAAEEFVRFCSRAPDAGDLDLTITPPANTGAQVRVLEDY